MGGSIFLEKQESVPSQMIPKIIHYCWFGYGEKPSYVERCISSWRKWLPDYEIKEWNETNFDVNYSRFTREAYEAKKYAFVSDVARFWILYHEGGLYFDTDVEIISSFEDITATGAFMGVENASEGGDIPFINPGLAVGAEAGNKVIKSILDHYAPLTFISSDGKIIEGTVVSHTTQVLAEEFGLQPQNGIQKLDGITIYPIDYFNPFNDLTGVLHKTPNTHSIHWFAKSWIDKPMWYYRITRILHRIFGTKLLSRLK